MLAPWLNLRTFADWFKLKGVLAILDESNNISTLKNLFCSKIYVTKLLFQTFLSRSLAFFLQLYNIAQTLSIYSIYFFHVFIFLFILQHIL